MPLVRLTAIHVRDGVTYSPNSVIEVDSETRDLLVSLDKAEAIVTGPAAYSGATVYQPESFVTYLGNNWVNTSVESAGTNVPGVGGAWVAVTYAQPGSAGVNFKLEGGELLMKSANGTYKKAIPTVVGSAITIAFED